MPDLHKSDNVYIIGKVQDEEEKKQREFKSLLNKLTPENFGKLLEKIIAVGITEPKTLLGLISQMFEKALTEPIFSSLYADLCAKLNDRFTQDEIRFVDPEGDEGKQEITFKRVLLNKCQMAFETSDAMIKSNYKLVGDHKEAMLTPLTEEDAERIAKEEAEKNGESEEISAEDLEEGEIAPTPKVKTLQELDLDRRREMNRLDEELLKSRRMMLGNIRFIGELFKKSMLTERIMHTCIQKLIKEGGEVEDAGEVDEEDVEALSKLLATVGGLIERNPKATVYMDAYFRRIEALTHAEHLSSRHRFMLQDVIELRQKGWKERRASEGPKKIDEIHRDAQRQAMEQARGEDNRRGGGGRGGGSGRDRGGGGPQAGAPPGLRRSDSRSSNTAGGRMDRDDRRGGSREDSRSNSNSRNSSKPMERPRIVQKPKSVLGGGSGGGGGGDGDFKVVEGRSNPPSRSQTPKINTKGGKDEDDSSRPETPRSELDSEFDEEEQKKEEEERRLTLEYYLDDKDLQAAMKSIAAWNGSKIALFVAQFKDFFDKKGADWGAVEDLVREISKSGHADAVLDGIAEIFNELEEVLMESPKADGFLAGILAHPLADGTIKLSDVANALESAKSDDQDKEETPLQLGLCLPLLCKLLTRVSQVEIEDSIKADANHLVEEAHLDLLKFVADFDDDKEAALAKEINRHEGLKAILDGE